MVDRGIFEQRYEANRYETLNLWQLNQMHLQTYVMNCVTNRYFGRNKAGPWWWNKEVQIFKKQSKNYARTD